MESGWTRLFGVARPEPVVVAPVQTIDSAMIKLQNGVDNQNTKIVEWTKKAAEKRAAAKTYKKKGNIAMANQMLTKEKEFLDLIKTANVTIAHRSKKIMNIEKSIMIAEVHNELADANTVIKGLNSTIDVSKMQETLIDNEEMGDEMDNLAGFMEDTSPYADTDALNAELDNLSLSDSQEDIDYDFPVVEKQPITNKTTSTTSTIPKSDLFEKLSFL